MNGTTVSINDYNYDASTNAIVFNTAPSNGSEVIIERVTSLARSINYQTYDNSFRPETLNYDLDRIWRVLQEQNIVDAEVLARLKDEIEWRREHDEQVLANINDESAQRRLIDEQIRTQIQEEAEWRRNLDLNYDVLAQVRDTQVFGALKQYLDTILASTSPNVFDGVTAGIVFALDKKSVQTHLEDIYQKFVEERQALQIEENRAKAAEQALDQKIEAEKIRVTTEQSTTNAIVVVEENRAKAAEQLLQGQINAVGVGNKAYLTYAAMVEDKANIPSNQKISVTNDSVTSNNGDWQYDGTSFSKSAFDPIAQSKNYSDTQLNQLIPSISTPKIMTTNLITGKFINVNGIEVENTGYGYVEVTLAHTRDLQVSTFVSGSSTSIRPVVFRKSDNTVILWGDLDKEYKQASVVVPTNAVKVYVNLRLSGATTLTNITVWQSALNGQLGNTVIEQGKTLENHNLRVTALESLSTDITSALSGLVRQQLTYVSDTYFNPSSNTNQSITNYLCATINVPLGITRFSFSGGTTTTTAIPISFRNSLGIVIGTYGAGNIPYTNEVVEIPLGTTQIIMNTRSGYVSDPQISFYRVNVRLSEQVSELIARPVTDSHWQGKAWASLGDSITAGSTWQPSVKNALSLTWTNFGVGGARISGTPSEVNAMCQDARINAIPTDVDLITLMGGTNDWAQSIPLGTITSTDPTTFYGALNTFAQKAFTRWPTKRITLATTPYGEIPAWESRSGWTSPAHNALGLTTNDYAEAVKIFCRYANIACIEVAQNAGYGTYNITEALGGSTTDHLHPSSSSIAAKGISNAFISELNKISPST